MEVNAYKTRHTILLGLFLLAALLSSVFLYMQSEYNETTMTTPPANPLYLDETQPIEARVADLLSYMSLEEKIGQMTLVEKNSLKQGSDIAKYHLGGLLSGAGAKPEEKTFSGWKEMIDGYQAEASGTRLGIPLLYGADAIHGHAHVPGATVFPHAIGLGAAGSSELVEAVAEATAVELAATGVNWSYSPNLDVPQDIRWGRVYEAFSDDPALVSALGAAYVQGLQSLTKENVFVLATPKHYLGLGSMQWNSSLNKNFKIDQGVTPSNETALRNVYLPPFKAAVDAGALSVMVGLNTWGDKRMVLQKGLLTDVLKGELGFKGFLVSDWYGVHEGRVNTFFATVQAVNAGVDMVMLPFDYEQFARHMKWANRLGLISDARIDDAVSRILYAKFALGLFDAERETAPFTPVTTQIHKAFARDVVAKTLVLLKNDDVLLPLSAQTPHIRVAGSAADNVGRQMGAWTIEWQGVDGNWPEGATSILEGIEERVSRATLVEYDLSGEFNDDKKADVGIAVVGEKPYAEGWGDTEYPILSNEDLQAIKNLQATSKKVVVIIVSGRPLLITEEVDTFDALIAAWLPGSAGAGVADVLFGDKPFVGTLPLPWPSHAEQLPISSLGNTNDGTTLLFPRYFGLTK